jgi:hypothetical protein
MRNSEIEHRAWERWLVLYLASQFSNNSSIQSFENYLEKIKNNSQQIGTKDEYNSIIQKAEETKARHQKTLKR